MLDEALFIQKVGDGDVLGVDEVLHGVGEPARGVGVSFQSICKVCQGLSYEGEPPVLRYEVVREPSVSPIP